MIPTEALADHLSDVVPADWSVVRGPISQLEPPVLVLRADTPWIEPSAFCIDLQQYAAIAVVTASTPQDGEADIYACFQAVAADLPEGWRMVSVGAPVVDQSTGTPFLAAKMTLQYTNTQDQETS